MGEPNKSIRIILGGSKDDHPVASSFNGVIFDHDDFPIIDVASIRIQADADKSGLMLIEVVRLKMTADGQSQLVVNGVGQTVTEHYWVRLLVAEGVRRADQHGCPD